MSDNIVLKEDRKLDISPNMKNLLVPNLDDKKIPLIYNLSRDSNFEVK